MQPFDFQCSINAFPFTATSDTEVLSILHLPIAMWLGVGPASSRGPRARGGVARPKSAAAHDQHTGLRRLGAAAPMTSQRYRITTEDGRTFEGRTDAAGLTEQVDSAVPFGRYSIETLDD